MMNPYPQYLSRRILDRVLEFLRSGYWPPKKCANPAWLIYEIAFEFQKELQRCNLWGNYDGPVNGSTEAT